MEYPKGKKPIVQDLKIALPVSNYIKIGKKGDVRTSQRGGQYRLPEKTDHFMVTLTERKLESIDGKMEPGNYMIDKAVHDVIGEKPRTLPIILIYNEIALNFPSRHACYFGTKLFCSGDGEFAYQRQKDGTSKCIPCPCYRADHMFNGDKNDGKGICRLHANLFCLINLPKYQIGGMARLSTSGYNATSGMLASMMRISRITNGILAGIPLELTLISKHTTVQKTGKVAQIYFPVIYFKDDQAVLRETARKILIENASYQKQIENIEKETLRALDFDQTLSEEAVEITEEFRPEEHIGDISEEDPTPKAVEPVTQEDPVEEIPMVEKKKRSRKKKVSKVEPVVKEDPTPETVGPVVQEDPIPKTVEPEIKEKPVLEKKPETAKEKPKIKKDDFALNLEGLEFDF